MSLLSTLLILGLDTLIQMASRLIATRLQISGVRAIAHLSLNIIVFLSFQLRANVSEIRRNNIGQCLCWAIANNTISYKNTQLLKSILVCLVALWIFFHLDLTLGHPKNRCSMDSEASSHTGHSGSTPQSTSPITIVTMAEEQPEDKSWAKMGHSHPQFHASGVWLLIRILRVSSLISLREVSCDSRNQTPYLFYGELEVNKIQIKFPPLPPGTSHQGDWFHSLKILNIS